MNTNRRDFLRTSAQLAALSLAGVKALGQQEGGRHRTIKKGIMYETVRVPGSVMEQFQWIKKAGFDGVEAMSHMSQEEVLRARDACGLEIPSVCGKYHWSKPLTDPDPAVREAGLEALRQTLRDAKRYGATSVLLVPAVVNKDVSYDVAYRRSQEQIRKALPLAEELGVKIAIENVGNHFLLSPLEAARYVDEFNSPAVGWHFDIGNVMSIGWPEQWIRILGKRIQKLHVKEYSRQKRNAEFLKGDNDWPAIMKAVDEIGYHGWGIAEQAGADSPEGLKKLSGEMDRIFAS